MGNCNCIPARNTTETSMKLKRSINSQENSFKIELPIKDNNKVNDDFSMSELSSKLQSSSPTPYCLSNREEMFFDSQPWMDSDIEDFLSVNGDFTPLDGNTPIHHINFIKTPQFDELSPQISLPVNSKPEASPAKVKQLIDYFQESFNSEVVGNDNGDLQDKTEANITFYVSSSKCMNPNAYESRNGSICSSERISNGNFRSEKAIKTADSDAQCCLPNFARSFSFCERKKRLSSAHNGGRGQ
ncbi:uncharacterized protein At3g27210-like [Mercurialis annua]|uniref:uncharacterized protein At3g27210-like n=1 Tax=Mercurialis annua TaxID=3986 RepID=UPI002160CF3E|nr:uncharacterized protein At3g27210-like [Mercurialis annua]